MIVGTGLISNAFEEYMNKDDIVIFASGVSNSKETSIGEFLREEQLLNSYLDKYGKTKYFIYFSTCSMFDTYFGRSDYTIHKMNMEEIIISKAVKYNIFRLSQVLGRNNKNQLVGFLYSAISNEKYFDLYNIERNIIDIEDIVLIVKSILKTNILENQIINIANPKNIRVIDLVNIIENITNKKAKYNIVEKKGEFRVNIQPIDLIISELNIFEELYLEKRIRNYYE